MRVVELNEIRPRHPPRSRRDELAVLAAAYYARRPCPNLAAQAAGILDEMLAEIEKENDQ